MLNRLNLETVVLHNSKIKLASSGFNQSSTEKLKTPNCYLADYMNRTLIHHSSII